MPTTDLDALGVSHGAPVATLWVRGRGGVDRAGDPGTAEPSREVGGAQQDAETGHGDPA